MGRPWASLGRLWGPLGQLVAPVGHFLGASWPLLGPSWPSLCWSVALLSSVLTSRGAPGVDFRRFWDVPGSVLDGFWSWLGLFSAVPRTSLHIVFIDAATALLHLLALCLLPFWCGGLCAAHGIRRTARRCPGVSEQCVGHTAGNTCRIYLREGPPRPKDQRSF